MSARVKQTKPWSTDILPVAEAPLDSRLSGREARCGTRRQGAGQAHLDELPVYFLIDGHLGRDYLREADVLC
jgi:hypothetical protein